MQHIEKWEGKKKGNKTTCRDSSLLESTNFTEQKVNIYRTVRLLIERLCEAVERRSQLFCNLNADFHISHGGFTASSVPSDVHTHSANVGPTLAIAWASNQLIRVSVKSYA